MNPNRNLIIIAGQNSTGKTTTFNTLTEEAKGFGISYEPQPLSDLLFMLDNLEADDKQGGFNHYHEWSGASGRHIHANGEPIVPFTVISNEIIDDMFHDFFTALANAPTDRLSFVEWTGGRNINPPDEPASKADFSFERIGKLLQNGRLPNKWLERVSAVVHPLADTATRYALNEKKQAVMHNGLGITKRRCIAHSATSSMILRLSFIRLLQITTHLFTTLQKSQ